MYFEAMRPEGSTSRTSWPYVESKSYLWTWLFFVPLVAYIVWQILYFLIVDVLRRQRLLRDPEVMTSYRFPSYLYLLYKSLYVHKMWFASYISIIYIFDLRAIV